MKHLSVRIESILDRIESVSNDKMEMEKQQLK